MGRKHTKPMSVHESGNLSLNGGSAQKQPNQTLEIGAIFGLLSNDRRRCALAHFYEIGAPVEFNALVTHVAQCEFGEDYATDERHTIYTSLYQTHLPRLKREGVIDYDRVSGTIVGGVNSESVKQHLDLHISESRKTSLVGSFLSRFC